MGILKTIILAAGEGKRMHSDTPKVLHKIMGKSMIEYVLEAATEAGSTENIIVIGHKGDVVEKFLGNDKIFVTQNEQLGTGHAVKMADEFIGSEGEFLILYGDTPLITSETIEKAIKKHREEKNKLTLISAIVDNPKGYGRIVRDKGEVRAIVEHRDASEDELKINEINTGIYIFNSASLKDCLTKINNNNSQKEYYLTDAVEITLSKGEKVDTFIAPDFTEFLGVNDRIQLHEATEILRNRINKLHMLNGVTIVSPETVFISKETKIETDTIIYPNVIIEGKTIIGKNCFIGSNSKIFDSEISNNVNIEASHILNSKIGEGTTVGPFAYVRPNSIIGKKCKIGDFVEVKNSTIGDNTKASHLTYIGDSDLGNNINLGCGTITVNYDGKNKARTIIEDDCFIGCNSNLIAPVRVHRNSYVAAGSTITDDVPENTLAIARERQVIKANWKKPEKK